MVGLFHDHPSGQVPPDALGRPARRRGGACAAPRPCQNLPGVLRGSHQQQNQGLASEWHFVGAWILISSLGPSERHHIYLGAHEADHRRPVGRNVQLIEHGRTMCASDTLQDLWRSAHTSCMFKGFIWPYSLAMSW